MGCTSSKLDDLPAVALCRERCNYLDEAIRQRFALAEAHVAYLNSLKAVGVSLDRFFSQDPDVPVHGPPSPVINLPIHRKVESEPPKISGSPVHRLSNAGSHLHFEDDSDDDDDGSVSDFHHHDEGDSDSVYSPVHQQHIPSGYGSGYGGGYFPGYENSNYNYPGERGGGGGGGPYMHMNFMKKQQTPSVIYTQRPSETMYMGESSSSDYSYANNSNGYNHSNMNPNTQSYYNSNNMGASTSSNYNNGYSNYGGGYYGDVYGGGQAPQYSNAQREVASTSKEPPPPPSPPTNSPWEFLNPFESFEKYYPSYTPSRDSREVREEEGIPDLEEDVDEIVKEVHQDQHFADSARSSYSKPRKSEENIHVQLSDLSDLSDDDELHYRAARPSVGVDSAPVEYDVHMVDKKVVNNEGRSNDRGNAPGFKARHVFKADSEVVREIQVQFDRASECGNELSNFLEVGKVPYKRKHAGYLVSSKILHLSSVSSQPSTSRSSETSDIDVDSVVGLRSTNLSSTLHKLHLWEKKLYEEVKVEERMRLLHEQKTRRLTRLDEKGAEALKIDATRTLVRSLSTKIKIAIQVVDKISVKINILRDDEMWPQLNEFIQGLARMWRSMLECHQNQCQAIIEAKRLDAIALRKHFSDSHFEATHQLEHDLINWTLRFTHWVSAQKCYVQALNNWLLKCLLYEPEETADGPVPFSPSRIGAPIVFVVCNQWWQSLVTVSEKEVVDNMREFTSNVLQLWEKDKAELRQRMLAKKDDRKIRSLDKQDQRIQKQIRTLDKRVVMISDGTGHAPVYQIETTKGGSIQASLQHVLEAMERFTSKSLKVYEDLMQRIEEVNLTREHERVA